MPNKKTITQSIIETIFSLFFSDLSGMYHYEGSLTTPECQEIVQWIVMDKPLYVRRWGLVSKSIRNINM